MSYPPLVSESIDRSDVVELGINSSGPRPGNVYVDGDGPCGRPLDSTRLFPSQMFPHPSRTLLSLFVLPFTSWGLDPLWSMRRRGREVGLSVTTGVRVPSVPCVHVTDASGRDHVSTSFFCLYTTPFVLRVLWTGRGYRAD